MVTSSCNYCCASNGACCRGRTVVADIALVGNIDVAASPVGSNASAEPLVVGSSVVVALVADSTVVVPPAVGNNVAAVAARLEAGVVMAVSPP